MLKFKNPVSVTSPTSGEHAANKDYVDAKQVTISWADYQALSEEEKRNGTFYNIPDMPTAGRGGVITTYTALEQLGLSQGASVADIVNAMCDCSYAEIGCYTAEDYGLQYVTGLPTATSNFLLTVRKYNIHRVDIVAKSSASGTVLNEMYIGGMLADGTEVKWEKVCTATGSDIEATKWEPISDTTFKVWVASKNTYSVKNGVCYVNISLECLAANTGSTHSLKTMPKAVSNSTACLAGSSEAKNAYINIGKTGELTITGGAKGVCYTGQIVYLVSEE